MERIGVDVILVHTSYDARKEVPMSPLDHLEDVFQAVTIPIQAVGGLTVEQAITMPTLGAPLVVLGAPLVIDAHEFKPSSTDDALERVLRDIVTRVKKQPIRRR